MSQINITFDMRTPDFGAPAPEVYETALEMAAYADLKGLDAVDLQEHHGVEDGYLPTPFLMGCAVAARTKRIAIQLRLSAERQLDMRSRGPFALG